MWLQRSDNTVCYMCKPSTCYLFYTFYYLFTFNLCNPSTAWGTENDEFAFLHFNHLCPCFWVDDRLAAANWMISGFNSRSQNNPTTTNKQKNSCSKITRFATNRCTNLKEKKNGMSFARERFARCRVSPSWGLSLARCWRSWWAWAPSFSWGTTEGAVCSSRTPTSPWQPSSPSSVPPSSCWGACWAGASARIRLARRGWWGLWLDLSVQCVHVRRDGGLNCSLLLSLFTCSFWCFCWKVLRRHWPISIQHRYAYCTVRFILKQCSSYAPEYHLYFR